MKKLDQNLTESVQNTSELDYIQGEKEELGVRVGWITKIDENDVAFIDFKGNPYGRPIPAELGRPFMLDDLKKAITNNLDIRLEFSRGESGRPIVMDIYYSVLEKEKTNVPDGELRDIVIKGRKIILEGDSEVIIKSGDCVTTYSAKEGKLKLKAKNISSTAVQNNRIYGAAIDIN